MCANLSASSSLWASKRSYRAIIRSSTILVVRSGYLDKLEFPCPLKARVSLLIAFNSILSKISTMTRCTWGNSNWEAATHLHIFHPHTKPTDGCLEEVIFGWVSEKSIFQWITSDLGQEGDEVTMSSHNLEASTSSKISAALLNCWSMADMCATFRRHLLADLWHHPQHKPLTQQCVLPFFSQLCIVTSL